jgi:UDP-GlcNAc:undecaprenyl-phosphate GlcNAc-1-phosphate transferase
MIDKKELLFCLAAFLICLAVTPIVRLVATQNGWVAKPRKDRWHKKETAQLGGIAIFLGISIPLFFLSDFIAFSSYVLATETKNAFYSLAVVLWAGIAFLFILGLVDDFIALKPHIKLIGQIIIASFVVFFGFRLHWFHSLTIDAMFSLVWIVGITNAFNLLDNMDGLCSGISMISAIMFAVLYAGMDTTASTIAFIVAGSCGAFLIYNFKPASIFMGDSGSLIIGFAISILGLYYGQFDKHNKFSAIAVPLLILMVPLIDTFMVTVIRLLSGRSASTGGKDHTSHRLVLMGFSEQSAVLTLYGIGFISGVAGLIVQKSDSMTSPAVIIPILLSMTLMTVYLSQLRVYPEKEFSVLRNQKFTPILIELTYKRQILMVMLDFCLVAFCYYLAYRLRFGGSDFPFYFQIFLKSLPVIIPAKLIVFYFSGIYTGFWQYISTRDVFQYVRGALLATVLAISLVTIFFRFIHFSKGVFIIDWILTTLFLLGTRGSFRLFTETVMRKTLTGDRVLIYGAGRGGELLIREILNNPALHIKPVGFIDDDPLKIGKNVQGFSILGNFNDINKVKEKHPISGILLSFNGHKNMEAYQRTSEYCIENKLFLKKFIIQLLPVDDTNTDPYTGEKKEKP